MIGFKQMQMLDNERNNYKRYCHCGHSIAFSPTSKKQKLICDWCGKYIYKNDKEKFKSLLLKQIKKEEEK